MPIAAFGKTGYAGVKVRSLANFIELIKNTSGDAPRMLVVRRGTVVLRFEIPLGKVSIVMRYVRATFTAPPRPRDASPPGGNFKDAHPRPRELQ